MSFILKQLLSFFHLLNSETGKNQIAAGIACGLILGFAPGFSLQTLLVVLLILFFRVQMGAATLSAFAFSFVAWLLDPIHHWLGTQILENPGLRPLFIELYHMPLVPLTRFNNSVVMGAAAVTVVAAPVVFFGSRVVIEKYRETIVRRVQATKFWKAVQATKFYQWYMKYQELYG